MKWPGYYLVALLLHAVVLWGWTIPASPTPSAKIEPSVVDVTLDVGEGSPASGGGEPATSILPAMSEPSLSPTTAEPPPVPAPVPMPAPADSTPLPQEIPQPPSDFSVPVPIPLPPPPMENPTQLDPISPATSSSTSPATLTAGAPGSGSGTGASAGAGSTLQNGSGAGENSSGGLRLLSSLTMHDAPHGYTGSVSLRVYVNNLGGVDKVDVVVSSGHAELDQAAIDTVKRARFRPAYDGNIPVSGRVDVRLSWQQGGMSYSWRDNSGF